LEDQLLLSLELLLWLWLHGMKSLNQNSGLGSLDSFPSVVVVDIGRLHRAIGVLLFFHRSKVFSTLVSRSGVCCC